MSRNIKTIAFYLPQFHPIDENNNWWSPGFTEWTNVSQARSLFIGHHQPHVPRETGFYDLRLEATRIYQAKLAKQYALGGFCYYHYWFSGRMLLDQPLSEVVESGRPDFPFCLCWANENWTRAWDGCDKKVLVEQTYSIDDAKQHGAWLGKMFVDKRYIKIGRRPLLLIYRPDKVQYLDELKMSMNACCREAGLQPVYLCAVKNGFVRQSDQEILDMGFDALVDFQPNASDFPASRSIKQTLYKQLKSYLPDSLYQWLKLRASAIKRVDYASMLAGLLSKPWPNTYIKFPCVFPSWDNSARRKTPTIIQNDDPDLFGKWLEYACQCVEQNAEHERIVFINAWNEWAEGCHLEPDIKNGTAFLEQTEKVMSALNHGEE